MKTALTILIAILTPALLVGCEKARLDQQVKELCAKDGGIKVYETVKLPPERFDQWGLIKPYDQQKRKTRWVQITYLSAKSITTVAVTRKCHAKNSKCSVSRTASYWEKRSSMAVVVVTCLGHGMTPALAVRSLLKLVQICCSKASLFD